MPPMKKSKPTPAYIEIDDLDPWLVDILNKGIQSDDDLRTVMSKIMLLVMTGKLTTSRADAIKNLLVLSHQSIQASKPPVATTSPALASLRAVMETADGHQMGIIYNAPGRAIPPWKQAIEALPEAPKEITQRTAPQIAPDDFDDDMDRL